MNFLSKIGTTLVIGILLAACAAPLQNPTPQVPQVPTKPTSTRIPTKIPSPTSTNTPIPTATYTPQPVKKVLLQSGGFGGDGGQISDFYFGRDTPSLVLYIDGQMIIRKFGKNDSWFEEATLTTPQICSFLSQVEKTGFFQVEGDGRDREADPIYDLDEGVRFYDGGGTYIIQINGKKHKSVYIESMFVHSLIPEVKQVHDLFENYAPSQGTTLYQPERMLLWVERGLGDSVYATPSPILHPWPTILPSVRVLEGNKIEGTRGTYLTAATEGLFQTLITGERVKPIFALFDNKLSSRLFQGDDSPYYLIARPLLPHETPQNFSTIPYQADRYIDLPFSCAD